MLLNRVWAMPNKWTFQIKPIRELLNKYVGDGKGWIDPFAGETSPAEITNDIEGRGNVFDMDAVEFLKTRTDTSISGGLFDPPYSVEQCLRRYTPKFKGTAGRAEYWGKCKDEIARILKPAGVCISFCWDSTGLGKNRGFEIIEILLVCHGACHNDTIVTVERKMNWTVEALTTYPVESADEMTDSALRAKSRKKHGSCQGYYEKMPRLWKDNVE